ncbi:TPM domain-containing protein [Comamonas kerstersii]|uniref:TPM domain-containing protein n=1 Tax=Comamonas kerstersii TaxID=225992 RepID=UPI001B320E4E|nr:TPM domain-containing protein [Comamonas kerstersii]QTW19048.1 TPM domain-containing protein [Comamonas kerstersii]
MTTLSQRMARLWRHRWSENAVAHAFPAQVLQHLEQQVAHSERLHTGQIRLCVEGGLPYSYIWRDASARERAIGLFGKLRTWDTEHNNGVLIYLLLADHAIEIIADRAMARAVPEATWQALVQDMRQSFQHGAFAQGMETALARVTELLTTHFPRDAHTAVEPDAGLPNAPVVQGRFAKD